MRHVSAGAAPNAASHAMMWLPAGARTEHDADVEQDGLHGVEAQEVRELLVAHDGEEEREEDEKRSEAVGVVRVQHRPEHVQHPADEREDVEAAGRREESVSVSAAGG